MSVETRNSASGGLSGRRAIALLARYGTLAGLVIMVVGFSIASPDAFPTFSNFVNIVNQVALTAIIAGGLTVVLIVGELDLSIGFGASLAGVLVTGLMVRQDLPVLVAIVVVVLVGGVVGVINSVIVTKARVNSVVATLGVGTILIGLNYAYSAGQPIAAGLPDSFFLISLGTVFGIPNNILIMAAVLTLLWVLVNRTDAGQRMQAVGGNAEASRLSGIRVDRVKVFAFVVSGMCAFLTGILLASLIGSGSTDAGDSYLLDAFAAVFLGSATLRDGEFHILGTFFGVLIIGVAFNGLSIFGAPTFYQYIFQGAILIFAVALSTIARRYAQA